MAGHVFIYNAAVRKVRDYIASGEIGEVLYVYSQRLNLGQVRRDANALWKRRRTTCRSSATGWEVTRSTSSLEASTISSPGSTTWSS